MPELVGHRMNRSEVCWWCGEFKCCFTERTEKYGSIFCCPEHAEEAAVDYGLSEDGLLHTPDET